MDVGPFWPQHWEPWPLGNWRYLRLAGLDSAPRCAVVPLRLGLTWPGLYRFVVSFQPHGPVRVRGRRARTVLPGFSARFRRPLLPRLLCQLRQWPIRQVQPPVRLPQYFGSLGFHLPRLPDLTFQEQGSLPLVGLRLDVGLESLAVDEVFTEMERDSLKSKNGIQC